MPTSPHGAKRPAAHEPAAGPRGTDASRPGPARDHGGDDSQDLGLLAAIRAGDRSAWRLLLMRHQSNIYNLCLRMVNNTDLASDLTQDTLVKVVQNLDRFDGRARFSTWLYRITVNVCLSRLRAEKLRRHASLEGSQSRPGNGRDEERGHPGEDFENLREPRTAEVVQSGEDRQRILRALTSLEPDQRAILVLRDARGLDYETIGAALEVPVGTVKSRLFRARLALRQAIEAMERDGGE